VSPTQTSGLAIRSKSDHAKGASSPREITAISADRI